MITQSERNAKARKALKEAGGKRIDVQLSREGVEALEALKEAYDYESFSSAIQGCITLAFVSSNRARGIAIARRSVLEEQQP